MRYVAPGEDQRNLGRVFWDIPLLSGPRDPANVAIFPSDADRFIIRGVRRRTNEPRCSSPRRLIDCLSSSGYPKVNAYPSAPGSRKVIFTVRSRTVSCWRTSW